MLTEKIRRLKDKKGFTLVELIVVLVILAILAALLIPTLTGYIDKANEKKVIAQTRMVVMAVQTEASSEYGTAAGITGTSWAATSPQVKDIQGLAELSTASDTKQHFTAAITSKGVITTVTYADGTYHCTYDGATKAYTTTKSDVALTDADTVTIK